ncbi:MAG: hypothetical protein JXM70_20645 [Pirellulales bacterium]|nr:hypothetical protein [Pirellulales bacterium]
MKIHHMGKMPVPRWFYRRLGTIRSLGEARLLTTTARYIIIALVARCACIFIKCE